MSCMKRLRRLIFAVALLGWQPLSAQDTIDLREGESYLLGGPRRQPIAEADTLKKWDFHLSMGSAMTVGNGTSASLFGISPSVEFRPNERLKVTATATLLNSYALMPAGYHLRGQEPRNLAPLRNPRGSAAMGALQVSASYRVNERLWVAASLTRVAGDLASGTLINPWLVGNRPLTLDATAMTASMRYRFKNDSFLDIHMTFIDDRNGALGPLLIGSPYSYGGWHPLTAYGL